MKSHTYANIKKFFEELEFVICSILLTKAVNVLNARAAPDSTVQRYVFIPGVARRSSFFLLLSLPNHDFFKVFGLTSTQFSKRLSTNKTFGNGTTIFYTSAIKMNCSRYCFAGSQQGCTGFQPAHEISLWPPCSLQLHNIDLQAHELLSTSKFRGHPECRKKLHTRNQV